MSADIRVDFSGAKASAVGEEHGISPSDLKALAKPLAAAHRVLREDRRTKRYGFYDLYKDTATLKQVKALATKFLDRGYENLVVLGIGGSALGMTALTTALRGSFYNLSSGLGRKGFPKVFVMDNVDPETFSDMLAHCDLEKTLFNVISKSGGTAETLSQMFVVLHELERVVGADLLKQHLVVTTGRSKRGAKPSPLEEAAKAYKLSRLEVPANVGGRFSVFSSVGLFPAAMLGMDLDALAAGCRAMDKRCSSADLSSNPAYQMAAYHALACLQKDKPISVMLPYADSLRDVADWYRQIWAESLGKRRSLSGATNHYAGQTPVKALGVTDQHSQLQLYLEGPNDKLITVLETGTFRKKLTIPSNPAGKPIAYLKGATLNSLLKAECSATIDALREAKRPVIRVKLPKVNEHTMGQLLYMFEVQTAMAGRLFEVDAFDQPAVERIKILTRKYLGRSRGKR